MSDVELNQVLELALKLTVSEQAKLLERVAAHLVQEVESRTAIDSDVDWTEEELHELLKPSAPKSGAEIAAMIESGELDSSASSDMINPHISDPVDWVNALRRDMTGKRNLDWGE